MAGYSSAGNRSTYDPNVDYSALIAEEAAKGVNANRQLLSQYETQRNAKIAGEGITEYPQTYIYTSPSNGYSTLLGSYSTPSTSGGGAYGLSSGGSSIIDVGSTTGGYYTATDQSGRINEAYDAAQRQAEAALQSAYEQQIASLDRAAAQIPVEYRNARNETSADAAIARQNLNEQFAASGLNTGAGGQARLAMSVAEQGNLSALQQQEAQALADLELQRAQAQIDYRAAIAEAVASNEMARAQALYNEAVRVDNSYRANIDDALARAQLNSYTAQLASDYGGGSGYNYGYSGIGYDPSVDYQALINEELAKGSGADAALLKQLEQQRNAKIAGEGITEYGQTNYYQNGYTPSGGGGRGNGNGGANTSASRPAGNNGTSYVGGNVAVPDSGYYGSNDSGPSRNYDILQSQLSSIPGLTEENKIAIIDDAVRNHRISPAEGIRLQNYLGY